jgi:hypothetical protein
MSRRPIALSHDLLRLQNEGYDLELRGGDTRLLIKDIPYVDAERTVRRGTLIMALNLLGSVTVNPPTPHTAYWSGSHPCHGDGRKITSFENPAAACDLGDSVYADFMFSAMAAYRDYHHKVTTYVGRIEAEAATIEPGVTARTFPAILEDNQESVFKYADTASSRAGIGALNDRLVGKRIGIVGLGGTGSYILDLIAKTHVAEIHLFDGDVFSQHNAFRAPGAPAIEQLESKPQKVSHFGAIYANMRNGIILHDIFFGQSNLNLLDGLDFVFLCVDRGAAKRLVVNKLVSNNTPFIEVGMGVLLGDGQMGGIVRLCASTPTTREQAAPHISYYEDDGGANEYATNIQIAELNALSAALAVIRWKKIMGIYRDSREQYYCGYSIGSGEIISEGLK